MNTGKRYSLKRLSATALVISLALTIANAGTLPLPSAESVSGITARDLKRHIAFLASDELGGRYTFSPSNRIAARYLATQLESYGYRGAARDGSFLQKVPFASMTIDNTENRGTLTAGDSKKEFTYPQDYVFYTTGDHTILKVSGGKLRAQMSGEMVFVGYGISSPKNNYDDYAGLDVKGKITVRVDNKPESLKNVRLAPEERADKAAAAHGAIGNLVISTGLQRMWKGFSRAQLAEEQRLWPRPDLVEKGMSEAAAIIDPVIPEILVGPSIVKALAALMGKEETYLNQAEGSPLQPRALAAKIDINTSINLKEAPPTYNVVGMLEGADPQLKDEYIVLSAHYDHLTAEQSEGAGVVYNGADDNGSGTAGILEIAQAFASGARPKRSVLVVFFTAEEISLMGSFFNTEHEPLVPLQKIVANFNMDMIGRSRVEGDTYKEPRSGTTTSEKNSVYIIGDDKHSSELRALSERTNTETVRLQFDYLYNDPNDKSRMYSRTDSYNFAKRGVPIITYFTGWHSDYHKPTDDLDKLDFEKMERISRLAFATSWRVANLDHRLPRDVR